MNLSLPKPELIWYLNRQLTMFGEQATEVELAGALARCEVCFSHLTNKYYSDKEGNVTFSHLHSAQYCEFLYFLSREAVYRGKEGLASAAYLLNKTINAIDIFYEVELPSVFAVEHPVGTVLGRAHYGEMLHVSQNVTVGNNHGVYPTFGKRVVLHFGSSVIGRSSIGDNVEVAANAYIKDEVIPSNCIVFGASPNLVVKRRSEDEMLSRIDFFKD